MRGRERERQKEKGAKKNEKKIKWIKKKIRNAISFDKYHKNYKTLNVHLDILYMYIFV